LPQHDKSLGDKVHQNIPIKQLTDREGTHCHIAMTEGLRAPKRFDGPRLVLLLLLFLWEATSRCFGADVECTTNHPFHGVTYYTETRHETPTRLFIAEVELTNANLRLRVAPGGPDPDGPGKWQTTLMAPTSIAAREGFDLVVNGDFFDARGIKDAEGTNSNYRAEIWAAVNGPAVTDGRVWSTSTIPLPCLVVHKDRKVTIEKLDRPAADDWEVVAGNTLLVQDGAAVPHKGKTRHPRTAVGLDKNGTRLILRHSSRAEVQFGDGHARPASYKEAQSTNAVVAAF
jgi:hypothetical protein